MSEKFSTDGPVDGPRSGPVLLKCQIGVCLTAFRSIGTKRDGATTSVIKQRLLFLLDDRKW
ncbi:MAG: hypothetical protein PHI66_03825 [Candidatus Pacebacteria bacterium]|nr:hypothetical protein [Candidatus Paceibacterota bacterium]